MTANAPPSNNDSTYTTQTHTAIRYLYAEHTIPMSSIPSLGPQIAQLFIHLQSHGSAPAGPPFFHYHSFSTSMKPGEPVVIQVGVPVAADFTRVPYTSYEVGVLPEGRYLETVHVGAPQTLREATRELVEYAEREGFQFDVTVDEAGGRAIWGGRIEWYETDPNKEPDLEKWQTRLSFKLAA